jgi:hypothetical protein
MDRMPPGPEHRALPTDPPSVNDYDILAEAYTAENEAILINAYYARPAILARRGPSGGRTGQPAAGSPMARSTMSSRPWSCTTWKTGGRRWPSCGAC